MFKTLLLAMTFFAAPIVTESAQASPLQPWDHYLCAPINQGDGEKIGAICHRRANDLNVLVMEVYYFGHLWRNRDDYKYFYANLSLDGSYFARRSLQAVEYGDDRNLPKRTVLFGRFIVSTDFSYPRFEGTPFTIFFHGEQRVATNNPPFSYDNMFGQNYHGHIKQLF